MIRSRLRRLLCVQVLVCCSFSLPRTAPSEEILKKAKDTYLGWKISDNEFKTCHGTKMEIGSGQIEITDKKCPEGLPPISAVETRWHGTLVRINKSESTLQVRKGITERTIYFNDSTKWTKGKRVVAIDDLKEGADVTCLGKVDKKGHFEATRIDLRR